VHPARARVGIVPLVKFEIMLLEDCILLYKKGKLDKSDPGFCFERAWVKVIEGNYFENYFLSFSFGVC